LLTINGPVQEKGEWSTRCSQELYQLQRSLCRSCKVAMGRAPAKWPIMKYPEESWIPNSDKVGELGDLDFGGRMDEWMDGWMGWWKI